MRHTYRYKNNFQYWTDRWEDLEVDSVMSNKDIYPLKYSENLINNDKHNSILEAGCGNGRLLKYYHNNGYDIFGIDFIDSAVKKLKKSDLDGFTGSWIRSGNEIAKFLATQGIAMEN